MKIEGKASVERERKVEKKKQGMKVGMKKAREGRWKKNEWSGDEEK